MVNQYGKDLINKMAGQVIGSFSAFLCFLPMFIIAIVGRKAKDPINFISGDTSLKNKVKNVKEYNQKMSVLFLIWSFCYLASSIMFLIEPVYGTIVLIFSCSIILAVMYIWYRIILYRCSLLRNCL